MIGGMGPKVGVVVFVRASFGMIISVALAHVINVGIVTVNPATDDVVNNPLYRPDPLLI